MRFLSPALHAVETSEARSWRVGVRRASPRPMPATTRGESPHQPRKWRGGLSPHSPSPRLRQTRAGRGEPKSRIQFSNSRQHSRGRNSPGPCHLVAPFSNRGRRESRAPTAPAAPCAMVVKESTRIRQVQPRHPGFPRAMVLRLIRALPGEAAFLAPVVREKTPAGSARVAAPGPHDFVVRCGVFVRRERPRPTPQRPSHPVPNVS
jgi:hypothetical protein